MFIARSREEDGKEQLLIDHLKGTEALCRKFGDSFENGEFAAYCGLMHDIGKYSDAFQSRVRGNGIKCDHATAGAKLAMECPPFGKLAAYCIAGHHSGLLDSGTKTDCSKEGTLYSRLSPNNPLPFYQNYKQEMDISNVVFKPNKIAPTDKSLGFAFSFFIRMVYSCLTDADYIDTERFMSPDSVRKPAEVDFYALLKKLNCKLSEFSVKGGIVNKKRAEILNHCISCADSPRGLFTLTVPTGGGKTLSSMAFALNHLIRNGMDRIIYVIPYTSIIEQNAEVFSEVLGSENVLEHHSNYDFTNPEDEWADVKKLATENWDMPIIVTTNIQFFESFFANKSSKCRKLHNVANSIIIFDEAQMLPVEYLKPCVRVIGELVKNYRCSGVLCSATQPALEGVFPPDIKSVEICSNTSDLYHVFRRTEIINKGILTTEELAQEAASHSQCLIIVNTRKHALKLFSELKGEGIFHLSTLLCPAHRKKIVAKIKARLQANQPCKVVSTPLIEAGVDVDFPVVFRALCGLDSLVQSAGRCNREGKLTEGGKVYWFRPEEAYYKNQPPSLELPIRVAEEVSRHFNDLGSPEAIRDYFEKLYSYKEEAGLDIKNIIGELERGFPVSGKNHDAFFNYNFKSISERFKLIDDNTYSIIIPLDKKAKEQIEKLKYTDHWKGILRSLQQYTVNVYSKEFEALIGTGKVQMLTDNTAILKSEEDYDDNTGILVDISGGIGLFY